MTEAPVPLAAQIEKVQRELRYAQEDRAPKAERMWSAVLATLQQHERAMAALRESVKLQSHYADLLNMYDEGRRRTFVSAEEWIERLVEIGTLAALDDAASAAATVAAAADALTKIAEMLK
jgi:hypothetical protein